MAPIDVICQTFWSQHRPLTRNQKRKRKRNPHRCIQMWPGRFPCIGMETIKLIFVLLWHNGSRLTTLAIRSFPLIKLNNIERFVVQCTHTDAVRLRIRQWRWRVYIILLSHFCRADKKSAIGGSPQVIDHRKWWLDYILFKFIFANLITLFVSFFLPSPAPPSHPPSSAFRLCFLI